MELFSMPAVWWLCSLLFALAVWPLIYFLFRNIPDRGAAFIRIFGLLIVGFFFWLLCNLQVVPNAWLSIWICAVLVLALGTGLVSTTGTDRRLAAAGPWRWMAEHWKEVLATELVFTILFAFMVWVRAYNPEALGTEKPMELAFINAILRSPYFPPNDPWLSGYAISYYHFGYILTAMLAKAGGIPGAIAFNLGVAGSFALAGVGSYGLLRNLLRIWKPDLPEVEPATAVSPWRSPSAPLLPRFVFASLLAPFTLLLLGNLEGSLEILHANQIGWEDGNGFFWQWLDIQDLYNPPAGDPKPMTDRWWWWWRASRVINDRALTGQEIEVIDEFPAFSYVLGDLHPHVLAMPFLMGGLALALEWLQRGGSLKGSRQENVSFFIFSSIALGGILFLNTWDYPSLFCIVLGAGFAGWRLSGGGFHFLQWRGVQAFLAQAVALAIFSAVCYLPFLMGFSSQAGGFMPNVLFPSKGQQYLVMFGTLLVPIGFWLASSAQDRAEKPDWRSGMGIAGAIGIFLLVLSLTYAYVLTLSPVVNELIAPYVGGFTSTEAITFTLARRLLDPLASLLPLGLIGGALAICIGWMLRGPAPGDSGGGQAGGGKHARVFIFLLIIVGSLLAIFPEYFFLRDMFGWRMNTVFKFYFQAWQFWSLAAAFSAVALMQDIKERWKEFDRDAWVPAGGLVLTVLMFLLGAVYFPMGIWTKTNQFQAQFGPSLDASAHLAWNNREDALAIEWLQKNTAGNGPVAEAVGGSYSEFARISTNTGIPSILGWVPHEGQWRGGYEEVGSRQEDLHILYTTQDWLEAEGIIKKYDIRYVYFGPLEYYLYGDAGLAKFIQHLPTPYQAGTVYIFEWQE